MTDRLELHDIFCDIVNITEPNADRHVYFQPPESIKMKYPAIRYYLNSIDNTFANNSVYKQDDSYDVIVIDQDPDSSIARKVSLLPKCQFVRFYTSDNLNHFVYRIHI